MVLDGRIDLGTMIGYWIAQVVGGILAGLALLVAAGQDAVASTATVLGPDVGVWDGFFLEALFTAIFLMVILRASASASAGTEVRLAR